VLWRMLAHCDRELSRLQQWKLSIGWGRDEWIRLDQKRREIRLLLKAHQ